MLRSRFEISPTSDNSSFLFRHQEEKQINLYAENIRCLEIESDVSYGPVSDIKVCNKHGRYSIEVQVQSLFKDQTESWIRIVNGIDKFVREAMLIQEEEKASVKPAAKARPILKQSSTSGWDSTPMKQRQWIDIETQESKDPHCFQVSKFFTRLLRHRNKFVEKKMVESITTKLLMNARRNYQKIQDIGQTT